MTTQNQINFQKNINTILSLAHTHKSDVYENFKNKFENEYHFTMDMYNHVLAMIRILNQTFHPDMQHSTENKLSQSDAHELQVTLNNVAKQIKKEYKKAINSSIELSFHKKRNDKIQDKIDAIKSTFFNFNSNQSNDNKPEMEKELEKLFTKWEYSRKKIKPANNDNSNLIIELKGQDYYDVYVDMVKDLFVYLRNNNAYDNLNFISLKMKSLIEVDTDYQYKNNQNVIDINKSFVDIFESVYLGQLLYDFNENVLTNAKQLANLFNQNLTDGVSSKYKINVTNKDYGNRIMNGIMNGYAQDKTKIIKNFDRNNIQLLGFLQKYYEYSNLEDNYEDTIKLLKVKNKKQSIYDLSSILIKCNAINFKKCDSNIIKDNILTQHRLHNSNMIDFQKKEWCDTLSVINFALYYALKTGNTFKSEDENYISKFIQASVYSETMYVSNENSLINSYIDYLEMNGKKSSIKVEDFQQEIQLIRDNLFIEKIGTMIENNPKLFEQLSLFTEENPLPEKVYNELNQLKIEPIYELSLMKKIQLDYHNIKNDLYHKRNKHFKNQQLIGAIQQNIYENLKSEKITLDRQIEFSLSNQNTIDILNLIQKDNDKEKFNTKLIELLNKTQHKELSDNAKSKLSDWLLGNKELHEHIMKNSFDLLKYKDSLLFYYVDEQQGGKLSQKLAIIDDLNVFNQLEKKLNSNDVGALTYVFLGLNNLLGRDAMNKDYALFQAYEDRDLNKMNTLLSKQEIKNPINVNGISLVSYMSFKGIYHQIYQQFNKQVLQLLDNFGMNKALEEKTKYAQLSLNDFQSARKRNEIFELMKDKKYYEVFNKEQKWSDKLLAFSQLNKDKEVNNKNNFNDDVDIINNVDLNINRKTKTQFSKKV